nr:MAG TPA: hypothetical protein [Caudoviricetes sp.]
MRHLPLKGEARAKTSQSPLVPPPLTQGRHGASSTPPTTAG